MTGSFTAALALSALVGVSLGLLGGGGSILAVPILIYVAGFGAREGIGASLALVGATSLFAGLLHWRAGRVELRAAAAFGAAGMVGAPLGAQMTPLVPEAVLLALFGGLMVVVGTLMLRRRAGEPRSEPAPAAGAPAVVAAGFGVGLLTGFLGVGGGFLIVPALALLVRLPMPKAVGTSLFVIALNALTGFAGHLGRGPLPLGPTAAFTASALLGALGGTHVAARLPADRLRNAFGVFVVVVGGGLAAHNLSRLLTGS